MLASVARTVLRRPGQLRSLCASCVDRRVTDLDDGSESTLGQEGNYTGPWDDVAHRPHGGVGTMVWDNGVSFEGEWRDGKFHGMGSKLYSRGGGYEGAWVRGRRHGAGFHIFAGKFGYERWEGPFVEDQPHGVGIMHFVDGRRSEFVFESGKPQLAEIDDAERFAGHVATLDDGSPSTIGVAGHYAGAWVEGRPHGYGVMTWENGVEYKGVWREGVYDGHGRKLYSRGGGYEGAWVRGKREGKGITFFDEGKEHGMLRWEGPFRNDRPHGSGQAFVKADGEDEHGRWSGDTAVKGGVVVFEDGRVLSNFPV